MPLYIPLTLGEKIKQTRFERGMTQDALASSAGITKASVSNYERNIRIPKHNVLENIARALNVPVSELLIQTPAPQTESETKRQPYDKRSKRLERMINAFDLLNDEAQIKAIERIEELLLIPEYQRPLPSVLQQYISTEYKLVYDLMKNEDFHKIYTKAPFSDERPLIVDIRRMTLDQQTLYQEKEAAHWEFFYYSSGPILAEHPALIYQLLEEITYPTRYPDDLSFVFDDEGIRDAFYRCFECLLKEKSSDIRPGFHGMCTLFILLNKKTGGIVDVKKLEPEPCPHILPGILQQYVREEYNRTCELVEDNVYMQPSFSERYPSPLQVRRVVFQQKGLGKWEFLYYSGERSFSDYFAAIEILKNLTYPTESQEYLFFIFDDSETRSSFHDAFLFLLTRSPKIDPGFLQMETLFILIDKKSGGIKDPDPVTSDFKKICRHDKEKKKVELREPDGRTHLAEFSQWNGH